MANIEELLEELKHRHAYRRWTAASRLGECRGPEVTATLCRALQDPHAYVRYMAAASLGRNSGPGVLPVLWKALEDPDLRVRDTIVRIAGRVKDPASVAPLCAALAHEFAPPVIRMESFWVRLKDSLAAEITEERRDFRHRLVTVLGSVGDETAIPPLFEILKHREPTLRSLAGEAIGTIAERHPGPALAETVAPLREMAVLNPVDRSLYRKLLPRVERALGIEGLPLAAGAHARPEDSPIPATPPVVSLAELPIPNSGDKEA